MSQKESLCLPMPNYCLFYIPYTYMHENVTICNISATKYMIKSLESYCVDFLVDNLNASNVFTVLKSCNTDKQRQMCMKFIRANTDDVLNDESFLSISHKFLTRLLSDDSLTVPEIRLFEAVCCLFYFTLFLQLF